MNAPMPMTTNDSVLQLCTSSQNGFCVTLLSHRLPCHPAVI